MGFSILNFFYLVIKDLNVFSEKKTNLGLFYLKNNLDIKLFFHGINGDSCKVLLKNIKLNTT